MALLVPSLSSRERRVGHASGIFGVQTRAGVRIGPDSHLGLSAAFAATQVICETVAAMPVGVIEQTGPKSREPASDHPMSRLIADRPCPGWDSMTWFAYQVALQVNGGNAFAEKQRNLGGEVIALWPIHPRRIPAENVCLADGRAEYAAAGIEPGEVVYHVRNDDGTATPIPARDMLHVPGRAAEARRAPAGVPYGVGVPDQIVAAESLGTSLATERAVSSHFANGMGSRFTLNHPGRISPEAKNELRRQWQETYSGPENANKTIITEEGMSVSLLSLSPEASQMLGVREFNVREWARWYRLPPHLLGDLGRATWANIDAEQLNFVTHSLLPWLVRWEEALRLQLLNPAEWGRYSFKFNVNGLLRGDYAARSAYYKTLLEIGVLSPNDIRALEDMNPVPGGDRYYIPTNNLTPSDRVDDAIDAKLRPATAKAPGTEPPQDPAKAERLAKLAEAMREDVKAVEQQGRDLGGMVRSLLNEDGERAVSLQSAAQEAEERIDRIAEAVESRAASLARRQAAHEAREAEFSARQRAAVRATLQATLAGLVALETRTVRQAAKDFRAFAECVEKFYGAKLPEVWSGALSPLSGMMEAAGLVFDIDGERSSHEAASRAALVGWDGVRSQELSGWVSERVESWSGRPAEAAARLVPERAE